MLLRHPLFIPGGAGVQDLLLQILDQVPLEQAQVDAISAELVRIDKITQLGATPSQLREEITALGQLHALQSCAKEDLESVRERIAEFNAKMLPVEFDLLEHEPPIDEEVLGMHGLELLGEKCNADNARSIAKALRRGNSLRTVLENVDTVSRKRGRSLLEQQQATATTAKSSTKATVAEAVAAPVEQQPVKLEMDGAGVSEEGHRAQPPNSSHDDEPSSDAPVKHDLPTENGNGYHRTSLPTTTSSGQKLKRKLSETSGKPEKPGNKAARPTSKAGVSSEHAAVDRLAAEKEKKARVKSRRSQGVAQEDGDFQEPPPVEFLEPPPLPEALTFAQAVKHTQLIFGSSRDASVAVGGGILYNIPVLQNLQVKCGRHSPWGIILGDSICVGRRENGKFIDFDSIDLVTQTSVRATYELYSPQAFIAQFQDKPRGSRLKSSASDAFKALEVRHSNGLFLGDYIQTLDPELRDAARRDHYIGVSKLPDGFYSAKLTFLGRTIELGAYREAIEAAKARDRALIRAKGVIECLEEDLNLPLIAYACDPLHVFTQYDDHLRLGLIHSGWPGPGSCDFSAVIVPSGMPRRQPVRVIEAQPAWEEQFGNSDNDVQEDGDVSQAEEVRRPPRPRKRQHKALSPEKQLLADLCDIVYLLRTPDVEKLREELNRQLAAREAPQCTPEEFMEHLHKVAWRIEACESCPWFVTKMGKRFHMKKRDDDPWDDEELRALASLVQAEKRGCILTLNYIFRHNYSVWRRSVKQIEYRLRTMCVKEDDIWKVGEPHRQYCTDDPTAVLEEIRQKILAERALFESYLGHPGVSEELAEMLTGREGRKPASPKQKKGKAATCAEPQEEDTNEARNDDEVYDEQATEAQPADDSVLSPARRPEPELEQESEGEAEPEEIEELDDSSEASAEEGQPMPIDSDDYEEDEPSTGDREQQPLTPDRRGPFLAVQYSSSPFGPDQERRCRQRMDGNSVVQNMLGMKKIVSFEEFDPSLAAGFTIPHDVCFMLGAIYERELDHSAIDEIVNAMRDHCPTRSRQEILEFISNTKSRLHTTLAKKRYPGVLLAGKDAYLFTLRKHGYGYCRSSLEAHLLRQQMPGSAIADEEEFNALREVADVITEYMQRNASQRDA